MKNLQLPKKNLISYVCSGLVMLSFLSGKSQILIDAYLTGKPTLSIKGNATTDKISSPADLEFNPLKKTELWVLNSSTSNTGSDVVIFNNTGTASQTSKLKKDYNARHFMCNANGMAFGNNGNFATTSNRLDDNHDGSTFTGPALWSSDPTIFGVTPTGSQNGTHLDMIHHSPYSSGIAFDPKPAMLLPSGIPSGNAYWVFDGYNGNIALNDFNVPHCVGCTDHDDGQIYVYKDVVVKKDGNIASHMTLNRNNGMMYICEPANSRVLWMNTKIGTKGAAMSANEGYKRWTMNGASSGIFINTGLVKPSGIDIDYVNKRLIVSDYSNGDIIIYNIAGTTPVEMGRIKTGSAGIMGLTIAPDGKIWYVNFIANTLVRVDPAVASGIDDQFANITVSTYPNPVSNELTVVTSFANSNMTDVKILIHDPLGRTVNEFKIEDSVSLLDLSSLTNGVYFYTIVKSNVVINNGKFVVSK